MIFDELMYKTNKSLNKIENNIKISDDILLYVHNKVDEKFKKDVMNKELEDISNKEKTLDELKDE